MEKTREKVGRLRDRCSECHHWLEKKGWWLPPLMEGEVGGDERKRNEGGVEIIMICFLLNKCFMPFNLSL